MENITTICGSPDNPNTWIYQLNDTGMYVRETFIDSVTPADTQTTIIQIADVHLNYTNDEDKNNEEVMYTKQCRKWNAGAASVKALKTVMEYAKDYDQTVITGDTLDYLSCGALELMDKYIWDVDPNCLVTLGGHDVTRQMQTGMPDKTPLSERQAILEKRWKHDIYYTSKVINDNVMIIQLDNGCSRYWDCQVDKLEKDLKTARQNGYTVLIFQHEVISTRRPEDKNHKSFYVWYDCSPTDNFYDEAIGYDLSEDNATTKVYNMILGNADIIRGIFCGHYHTSHYMELDGTYKDADGNIISKKIPQYVLECNVYCNYEGHVLKITVK